MLQKCFITNDGISHNEMLGSQTFNYFTLCAIAKKTGHQVAISTAPHRFQGLLPQCFDLPFPLSSQFTPYDTYTSKLCTSPVIEEDLFNLNPYKNYVLNARFDYGSLYWGDVIDEIKPLFKIKQVFLDEAQNIIQSIQPNKNTPLVSLTFRRGVCSFYMDTYMSYYENALKLVPQDAIIMVMCDDFEWVNTSKELQQLLEGRNVLRANYRDYVQLSLITLCDYNILNPSSFCLLGAILSKKSQTNIFPNFHNTPLLSLIVAQFMVDKYFPDWIQVRFNVD
jgi:hypothetical protein